MYDAIGIEVRPTASGDCRVTVAGELDVCSAPAVRTALRDAVSRHDRVEVDCAGLRFCDCAGLSALQSAAHAARTAGTELRLYAVPQALARLLRHFRIEGVSVAGQPPPGARPDVPPSRRTRDPTATPATALLR
ncbi:STAS domain-containing protein [Streptomyces armeniacus]|nr:STAS domain-containing protein [Streptomyces armeniacus]